jgi:hypothetical protein
MIDLNRLIKDTDPDFERHGPLRGASILEFQIDKFDLESLLRTGAVNNPSAYVRPWEDTDARIVPITEREPTGGAKTLNERDRTRVGFAPLGARLLDQQAGNDTMDDAQQQPLLVTPFEWVCLKTLMDTGL